jgi:hypothetical protein
VTAYAGLAGWWTVTAADAPTFSGRRSIATVELRGSAPGIAGELQAKRETAPPEHELPLATIDAPEARGAAPRDRALPTCIPLDRQKPLERRSFAKNKAKGLIGACPAIGSCLPYITNPS